MRATHSTPADQRAEEADLETRLETISASLRSCWEGEAASGEVAAEMQRVSLGQTGRSPAEGFPSADRPSDPPHLATPGQRLFVRSGGALRQEQGRSSKAHGFNCHCSQTRRGVSLSQTPLPFQVTRHQHPSQSKLKSKVRWTSPLASPGGSRLGMWEQREFLGSGCPGQDGVILAVGCPEHRSPRRPLADSCCSQSQIPAPSVLWPPRRRGLRARAPESDRGRPQSSFLPTWPALASAADTGHPRAPRTAATSQSSC